MGDTERIHPDEERERQIIGAADVGKLNPSKLFSAEPPQQNEYVVMRPTDTVMVKLTDLGKQRYRDYAMGKGGRRDNPQVTSDGYTLMPMWELFAIYGGALPLQKWDSHFDGGVIHLLPVQL